MTVAISVELDNSNRFGSHFDDTPVALYIEQPPDTAAAAMATSAAASAPASPTQVATMTLPSGYIGAHSQLALTMTTNLVNTRVSGASALLQLLRQLRVSSDATTHGKVSFFGMRIPYAVHTQCAAVWTL
jgi:hypothetical protein